MSDISVRRELNGGASLETLRSLLDSPRPASLRAMLDQYSKPIALEEPLITADGVALGGHQRVTLHKDGSWKWEGHFRATGFWSYDVSLATQVLGRNGSAVALAVPGRVSGTNESGEREFSWNKNGRVATISLMWANLREARLYHDLQYDTDFLGSAGPVLSFLTKAFVAGTVFGTYGFVVALSTELVDALDLEELSLPGISGLIAAGGVFLVMGPAGLVPATILGIAVGAAVMDELDIRRLEPHEYAHFNDIFGGQLPARERIVLTNLLGLGGRAFVWPGPGNVIWVNVGEGVTNPIMYRGKGGAETATRQDGSSYFLKAPGQLLVHELTHAWQIEHSEYIPSWMCSALAGQVGTLGGDMDVYKYDTPYKNWSEYNEEQQASIVDEWYGGSIEPNNLFDSDNKPLSQQGRYPARLMNDEDQAFYNPYWRFIRDNIHTGVA